MRPSVAVALLSLSLSSSWLDACARTSAQAEPATSEPAQASSQPAVTSGIRFLVEPDDAEIFVGDEPKGSAQTLASAGGVLALSPGDYAITLKRDGFKTWRAEVALTGQVEVLEVKMEPLAQAQ